MARKATGHLFRRKAGRIETAKDDGTVARHYLRTQSGGRDRTFALGSCAYPDALRRADRIAGHTRHAQGEEEWLRSLVALGESARASLEMQGGASSGTAISEAWGLFLDRADISREPRTLAAVQARWQRFVKWAAARGITETEKVTPETAREYAAFAGAAKLSADRDLNTLRAIWKAIGAGPAWEGIKPPRTLRKDAGEVARRYRRLDTAEIRRLLAKAAPEERLACLLAYSTALRLSDVVRLQAEDIRSGCIEATPGKTRGAKSAPLSIPVSPELEEALAGAPARGSLFPQLAALREDSASRRFAKLFEDAEVEDDRRGRASFHSFRATFISLMDEAGIPPHVTDAMTGHAKQGMHGRYSQPSMGAKREAVTKALPRIFPLDAPAPPVA